MTNYAVCGCKPWCEIVFRAIVEDDLPGRWYFIRERIMLEYEFLKLMDPKYVFFLHWSWPVPKEITDNFECIGFHMTDLPYGRGGSPLQNLVARGKEDTVISAFRMTEEVDGGPIYLKVYLPLEGRAQEIYEDAMRRASWIIERIVRDRPEPIPQYGEPTYFERRTPRMSEITAKDKQGLYDHIRMLDAETYPHAFLEYGAFRYEFSEVSFDGSTLSARAEIDYV